MALGGSRFCYFCHMESATFILHNLEWDRYNHTGVRRILELAHIDLILLPLLFIVSVPLVRLNTQRRVQVSRLGITPLTLTLTPDDIRSILVCCSINRHWKSRTHIMFFLSRIGLHKEREHGYIAKYRLSTHTINLVEMENSLP